MTVKTSKKLSLGPPDAWESASTRSMKGSTSSHAAMKPSREIARPSMQMRSRTDSRCGEVNRPVRSPRSRRSASTIREVDVFPFVPVMWIAR